jgi:peptide subunit release factor 1 (eRF1)
VIYALETGILDSLILHEAKQIKNGFGGIVGLLRYPITFDFFPN